MLKDVNEVIIIEFFDWQGTPEGLEEYVSAVKKALADTPGTKYIGKYSPVNSMYNYSLFLDVKDYQTWDKVRGNFHYKRDNKTLPHLMQEFFV
jgi:hypothetical protein